MASSTKTGKKSRDLVYKRCYHTDQKFTVTDVGADGAAEYNVLVKEISTLESMVNEEKTENKRLSDEKIKLEIDLDYQDQVIEKFECKTEELKDQLEICKKKNEELTVIAMASGSVAIALGAVLFCILCKMH